LIKFLPVLLITLLPALTLAGENRWQQEKMIAQWLGKAQQLPQEQRGTYLAEKIAMLIPETRHTGRFCRVRKNR
jgi:hypothetical protein